MTTRKAYSKPTVKKVTIDNEISLVMMSVSAPSLPSGLPLNPLKWWK